MHWLSMLGFLGIRFAFFHLVLVAQVLHWVLFSKLLSSSQLLEPQHVPRACSLLELLSVAATVISKTSHHSAWATWEMKITSFCKICLLEVNCCFFFPKQTFPGDVFKGCHVSQLRYSVDPQLPSHVDHGGFCSMVAKRSTFQDRWK